MSLTPPWRQLFYHPETWKVRYAHYQDGTKLTDALNEGWEPFAVEHDVVWLRRLSRGPHAPLPPQ